MGLAHFSIKEYLESDQIQRPGTIVKWPCGMDRLSSNLAMARVCLAYLFQFDKSDSLSENTSEEFPLARYAAEFWTSHCQIAPYKEGTSQIEKQMRALFMHQKEVRNNWLRLFNPDIPEEKRIVKKDADEIFTPLYYASLLGLNSPIHWLLESGVDIHGGGGFHGNTLGAASFAGFHQTVQLLLDLGANVNFRIQSDMPMPDALQAASYAGHAHVVILLLASGANPNSEGGLFGNSLQAAALQCHNEIVTLLLEAHADVNIGGGKYDSPLTVAALQAHEETMKLLLKRCTRAGF